MRALGIGLWALAAVSAVLSALFSVWAQGMACAIVGLGSCRFRWPWQLPGDELVVLIGLPGTMVAGVAGGPGWSVGAGCGRVWRPPWRGWCCRSCRCWRWPSP